MPYTYVTPNATVWLLKDVPLSNDYEHTVLFERQTGESVSSAQERQKQTFVGTSQAASPFLHRTFTQQMYKRVNRETIKVDANYDDIYMCNYMVFQNYSNSPIRVGKTYYAFILEMNYKNEGTTEIVYEIDVMQTWMFDYQIMPSFVEREHSEVDYVGFNTVPEPIDKVDCIKFKTHSFKDANGNNILNGEYSVVIVAPWKYDSSSGTVKDVNESFYGRMFSPLAYNKFHITGASASVLPNYLTLLALFAGDPTTDPPVPGLLTEKQKQEIVAIYIMPTKFVFEPTLSPSAIQEGYGEETAIVPFNNAWQYKRIVNQNGQYVKVDTPVRNKKLYTHPYNFLYVVTSDGAEYEYKFEYFFGTHCEFALLGTPGTPPQIQLIPNNYKRPIETDSENASYYNLTESLTINNFPLCPWVTDTFKAWLAQNATKMLLTPLTKAASAGVWGATGHPMMATAAVLDTYTSIVNSVSDTVAASMMPDDSHGVSGACIGLQTNALGFNYQYARVKDEQAVIIDDFFDKYGYATKQVKVPNRNVREEWCYTKTIGCLIKGVSPIGLPSGAEDKIISIYDKGITFWKNIYHIGQYDLSNRCVAEL